MMYEYWLAGISGINGMKKRELRKTYKTAEMIYYIEETKLKTCKILSEKELGVLIEAKKQQNLKSEWEKMQKKKIRFIPYFAKEYPRRLTDIPHPPYALYVRGNLPDETMPAAAIVGARNCTYYGERLALEYGECLAENGVAVISGMARGIDGAGQRGALNAGGMTYGVLGCGVDVCYPKEHQGLYKDLMQKGGLISEQLPGSPPFSSYFPARNRIISGLADVVLVIEAKEKSGSLITVDQALEQGRDIYALPGPVTSPQSQGCHRLIAQGAGILISPEELMKSIGITLSKKRQNKFSEKKVLESPENMVYSCVGLFPKGLQELAEETKLAPETLMEHLMTLELQGLIKEISKNYYVKIQ